MRFFGFVAFLFLTLSCRTTQSQNSKVAAADDEDDRAVQLYRFDPWMDQLRQAFESNPQATVSDVAKSLTGGPTRVAAYNLQGLARFYQDLDNEDDQTFHKMRDDFKDVEDKIGQWDKWDKILAKIPEINTEARVLPTQKRSAAARDIEIWLVDREWFVQDGEESRLAKIQRHLDEYPWPKRKVDRAMVLGKLKDELKAIETTPYQFTQLEEGDGLHELRRDIKWVVIEARILNGLITYEKDTGVCAIPKYADLVSDPIAVSKYSQLPTSEAEHKKVCYIDQCLFLGLVDLVDKIGEVKDKVEVEVNSNGSESDEVPAWAQEKMQKIYDKMIENDLLDTVHDQIKACLE